MYSDITPGKFSQEIVTSDGLGNFAAAEKIFPGKLILML